MASRGKSQLLSEILQEIKKALGERVEASVIVTEDGLPISSLLPVELISEDIRDEKETEIAAMTATILSVSKRAMEEFKKGDIDKILIDGKNGALILMSAKEKAILAVLTRETTNLGLLFLTMKRATEKIAKVLE
ncbi:MAG: roadblock/LC7 domain-containing protein [Candidatus Asgardarchaeia archaeon]